MRRDFLKWCAAAGLGLAVPDFDGISFAADKPKGKGKAKEPESKKEKDLPVYDGPFYLVCNASGGWDTTYMMDPKGTGGINRLYKDGDIQTSGAIKFAPTAKTKTEGMSNEDFFTKYSKELLVLNGLDYSVNNHSPCARYMATGHLDSLAYPTFSALVAATRGRDCPLAFLTFGNYSGTGNLVAMSRVPYIPSLQGLSNADAVGGNAQHPYHEPFVNDRIEEALAKQHDRRMSQMRLPRRERADNMLYAAQWNSQALSRVTPFIPKSIPKDQLSQQAEIALAAFKAGVCVSANLSIGQFDSHQKNDEDQMKLIPRFLASIDYFLRRAEEMQIREKLVVILQSEMGRTPTYNNGAGKDHWSLGSIMFLGPKIKGNRVIGATNEKQFAIPINPQTLALDKDKGMRVRPEHIQIALREYAGIENHAFSKQFPFKVKDEEKLKGLWG